MASAELN